MRIFDWLFLAMPLWVGTLHALRFAPSAAVVEASTDRLLLEDGASFLLLESSGDELLLE